MGGHLVAKLAPAGQADDRRSTGPVARSGIPGHRESAPAIPACRRQSVAHTARRRRRTGTPGLRQPGRPYRKPPLADLDQENTARRQRSRRSAQRDGERNRSGVARVKSRATAHRGQIGVRSGLSRLMLNGRPWPSTRHTPERHGKKISWARCSQWENCSRCVMLASAARQYSPRSRRSPATGVRKDVPRPLRLPCRAGP